MVRVKPSAALLLAAVIALLLVPALASAANPSTTVSLTFDDGYADQYEYALPALSAHGIDGTFYIITGLIKDEEEAGNPEYMTWAELHGLANAGDEIAGHTVLHEKLTQLTTTEAEREVCNDRVNLINQGFEPTDFAYPNGAYDPALERIVEACGYNSARTVGGIVSPFDEKCTSGCPFAEGIPPVNPYAFRTPDSVISTMTLSQIEELVTQAESAGGGWVPIVFHQICEVGCREPSVSPAEFNAFVSWLAQQRESGAIAVKTVHEVIGGTAKPGVLGPPPTGTSLENPSLENPTDGEEPPTCWQEAGYGVNTASFTRTDDARSGSWAGKLTISNYESGDAKVLVSPDEGECSPAVTPGRAYTVSSWFKSTTPINLVAYYRDQVGSWHYLGTSPAFAAASSWTDAQWTTPAMPSDATAISFGPKLTSDGSVTFDDLGLAMAPPTIRLTGLTAGTAYSGNQTLSAEAGVGSELVEFVVNGSVVGTATHAPWSTSWSSASVPNGPATITARSVDASGDSSSSSVNVSIENPSSPIKNASLEWSTGGESTPDCWATDGYGENSFAWTRTSDAHSGSWAERVEITSLTSGDRKLLQTQDSGQCAPAVAPGDAYTLSTWFKSNIRPYFVVFTRASSGTWSYWTSSPAFSGSPTGWTEAAWTTPTIPSGTTNISFGLDLTTVGFLTVDDFGLICSIGCDTTPPGSQASSPAYAKTNTWAVSYTASDSEGGSGLAEVDLYAKAPGQSGYAKVASEASGAGSGSFTYTASAGEGTYSFYTLATDKAGNVQLAPASAQATTLLDATAPSSQATSPAYANTTAWTVPYTASDGEGGSGLAEVDLYAKAPGQSGYAKVASEASGAGSGSFTYTASAGEGTYSFYTLATDKAGNVQLAPSSPNATTQLDKLSPSAFKMTKPAKTLRSSVALSLATVPTDTGSGLASVTYQYRVAASSNVWSSACTVSASPWGCSWNTAMPATPDGGYELRALAADLAGNTTVASNTPFTSIAIDNPVIAKGISTTNVSGSTVGVAQAGDSMTFTFSEAMKPSSILEGWTGAAAAVEVKFVAKSAKDTTLTVWNAGGTAQLALANPLNLGVAYVPSGGAIFHATMVQNGTGITVTLGSLASGAVLATAATGGTVTWTPSAEATDLAGYKCAKTKVTAAGPAF